MKIIVEISDKLFTRDVTNKFQDFFDRVIADIADGLESDKLNACGRYEMETATLLKRAFYNGEYETE